MLRRHQNTHQQKAQGAAAQGTIVASINHGTRTINQLLDNKVIVEVLETVAVLELDRAWTHSAFLSDALNQEVSS